MGGRGVGERGRKARRKREEVAFLTCELRENAKMYFL